MLAHARRPAIVDAIEDLLGTENIKLYGDQLFPKPVHDAGWHQDLFRGVLPSEVISAWTAIDAATLKTGALHYIPGSHRWGAVLVQRNPSPCNFQRFLTGSRWD